MTERSDRVAAVSAADWAERWAAARRLAATGAAESRLALAMAAHDPDERVRLTAVGADEGPAALPEDPTPAELAVWEAASVVGAEAGVLYDAARSRHPKTSFRRLTDAQALDIAAAYARAVEGVASGTVARAARRDIVRRMELAFARPRPIDGDVGDEGPGPDATGSWGTARWAVLDRDGHSCVRCGLADEDAALHVHHRRRRAAGGGDAAENLVTLCSECHAMLHRRDGERFRQGSDPGMIGVPSAPPGDLAPGFVAWCQEVLERPDAPGRAEGAGI